MNKYIEHIIINASRYYYENKKYAKDGLPKGILVTLFTPIGDTIVSIPFFRELRRNCPDYCITLITNKTGSEIFAHSPYVDKILLYDDKARRHHFLTNLVRAYHFAEAHLGDVNYEISFAIECGMPRTISAWLSILSGAQKRFAFTECARNKEHEYYMGAYDKFFTSCMQDSYEIHDLKKNLNMLEFIGIKPIQDNLEVWVSANEKKEHVIY